MRRMKRAARKSVRPEPAAELLDPLFRALKLDEAARSFRAARAFAVAAGPRIRAIARAERLRGTTLHVRVATSAWSHELHALKAQLVDKLRRTPGGQPIEDLRFSVGPLDELPDWEAPRAGAAAAAPPPAPADTPLDAELARALESVRDPELRADLAAVLIKAPRH
jgi:Dna[CI] antecedent, DciA